MSNAKLTLADLFGYSLRRSRRLRSRYHSHPKIHWGDPYNPWWWRLWCGLAQLVDGVIAVGTLGMVTSGYGTDAHIACLRWGFMKMEKEEKDNE